MVVAVITIITGTVLFSQQRFNSSTLLRSAVYSSALSVRQAQVYGTSVRETSIGSGNFSSSYGVYFLNTSPNTSYILFADMNTNRQYDAGEAIQSFLLSNGFSIKEFCATVAGGSIRRCNSTSDSSGAGTLSWLTVSFVRPNTDALIATDLGETYTDATVQFQSPGGDTRAMKVTNTGQISVCSANIGITSSC